jgi:hypothetical protein
VRDSLRIPQPVAQMNPRAAGAGRNGN